MRAMKRCKDLIVVHVATYAEGELEAKYHEKPDAKTHKVRLLSHLLSAV